MFYLMTWENRSLETNGLRARNNGETCCQTPQSEEDTKSRRKREKKKNMRCF